MGTILVTAVISEPRILFDAYLVGDRQRHSRALDHYGTQTTDVVVLADSIGPYPQYAVLTDVLEDMIARIAALEAGIFRSTSTTFDAIIWAPGSTYPAAQSGAFVIDATLYDGVGSGFIMAQAIISSDIVTRIGTFTAYARIYDPSEQPGQQGDYDFFTIRAFIV